MSGDIKSIFSNRNALMMVQGDAIFETTDNGREPHLWDVRHFANIGRNEEFVRFLSEECPRLLEVSTLMGSEREAAKAAILNLLIQGMMPTFEVLRTIRASVGVKLPVINRNDQYENFANRLWYTYKELLPQAALALGFDIGFLFQKSCKFASGLKTFSEVNPVLFLIPDTASFFRAQKDEWQDQLAQFRNTYVQHSQSEQSRFAKFYEADYAEFLFRSAWTVIAALIPAMISATLYPLFNLEGVPDEERSKHYGDRFRFKPIPMTPR